jgi:hypothetical protein
LEIETGLRVASDRILTTLEQLDSLESEKRRLKPDSERFQLLSREIERLAAEIFAQSHAEQALGEQAQAAAARSGTDLPSIDDSIAARDLSAILAEWRDAERRLQLAAPDSAEHSIASGDIRRLREEYQRAYSASQRDRKADWGARRDTGR